MDALTSGNVKNIRTSPETSFRGSKKEWLVQLLLLALVQCSREIHFCYRAVCEIMEVKLNERNGVFQDLKAVVAVLSKTILLHIRKVPLINILAWCWRSG